MKRPSYVVGVGMIPFAKPGTSEAYDIMGARAVQLALKDAGLEYSKIEQAHAGYVYGDSTAGQAALYRVGMSGIPVFNVNNNCASGSSALFMANQAVASGAVECALAVGFEQMNPGALDLVFKDRPSPMTRFIQELDDLMGQAPGVPPTAQFYAGAARDHAKEYGTKPETFAKIRAKASRHAAANPLAIFRKEVTEEEVLASPTVLSPLTRLQCCPPTCGAAATIVCSEDFANRNNLNRDVIIAAQSMTTDYDSTFEAHDMRQLIGVDMTRAAARQVYEQAGVGPDEISVCELHDCFTTNELVTYEALGLTTDGGAEKFILDGDNTYGGQCVTNPSGGLLSKGHPLGATGLAQCYELVHQLRGTAEQRQVDGARLALQHNMGLGGACVVTLYQKA